MRGLDLFVSSGMKVNVVSLPDNDDPDTFLKKNGYEAFSSCLRKSEKFMDFVLGQVVKGGLATSIDDKVEKAGEMLGYIARLPSGIERDHYLKRTAEALDLDEGVLRQELPRQGKVQRIMQRNNRRLPRRGAQAQGGRDPDPSHAEGRNNRAEPSAADQAARLHRSAVPPGGGKDLRGPWLAGHRHGQRAACRGDEELNHIISHYSSSKWCMMIRRSPVRTAWN